MKVRKYNNFRTNETRLSDYLGSKGSKDSGGKWQSPSDKFKMDADEYYDIEIDNMTLKMSREGNINSGVLLFHDRYEHVVMAYTVNPYIMSYETKASKIKPGNEPRIYKHLHTDYAFLHKNDKSGEILISKLQDRFPKLEIDMESLVTADDIGW